MPDDVPSPPADDPRKDITGLHRLRPLSVETIADPPGCVKCGVPTFKCCDGVLGSDRAWFIPICTACFNAASAPPSAPPPAPES